MKIVRWLLLACVLAFVGWASYGVFLYFQTRDLYSVTDFDMMPGLRYQDVVRVDRDAYRTKKPEAGDIVLFRINNVQKIYRIVAVPGDSIVFKMDGKFVVNNQPIPSTFVKSEEVKGAPPSQGLADFTPTAMETYTETLGAKTYDAVYPKVKRTSFQYTDTVIPMGENDYFVLGDNRDAMSDSRMFGPVKRESIVGRVVKIVDSTEDKSKIGKEL